MDDRVESIPVTFSDFLDAYIRISREKMAAEQKREDLRVELYEKRTMVLERLADAVGHYNEQQFHTTR
jgi:cytochrome c-type biogenesis protein CcmH/NrfG